MSNLKLLKQKVILFLKEVESIQSSLVYKIEKKDKIVINRKSYETEDRFNISFSSVKLEIYFGYKRYKEIIASLIKSNHLQYVEYGKGYGFKNKDSKRFYTRLKLSWNYLKYDFEAHLDRKKYKNLNKCENRVHKYRLSKLFSKNQITSILSECEFRFEDCLTLSTDSSFISKLIEETYEKYKVTETKPISESEYKKFLNYTLNDIRKWNEMTPLQRTSFYSVGNTWYDNRWHQNRIYSLFTRIPSTFREYIDVPNLYDLDVKNCFPLLFCLTAHDLDDSINYKQTEFFRQTKKGTLYEFIQSNSDLTRSQAKVKVNKWLNCRMYINGKINDKHIEFASIFPDIDKVVRSIKKKFGYKHIGYFLGMKETEFTHGILQDRLLEKGVQSIKMHDGIMIIKDRYTVRGMMRDLFDKHFNMTGSKISMKTLKSDDLDIGS